MDGEEARVYDVGFGMIFIRQLKQYYYDDYRKKNTGK